MKDLLIESARTLTPPSGETIQIFENRVGQLISLASRHLEERGDMDSFIGPGNAEMAWDNNGNFARFMISMFKAYQADVFVETILWVFQTYRSHGFKPRYWEVNLGIWLTVMAAELPETAYQELRPFYTFISDHVSQFTRLTDKDTV